MSLDALVERAHAQLAGPRSQRLMLWRTTLPTAVSSPDFLQTHAAEFCGIIEATLPAYEDKTSRQAVLSCLAKALAQPAFVKSFATHYVKTLASSPAIQGHSTAVINTASCGCALLSAMTQPDFAKGLPKVLQAVSTSVASLHGANSAAAQNVCIRRLSATVYSSSALLQAAQGTPVPIIAAALLHPRTVPPESRSAAVSAYVSTVISSKEKLPEAQLLAWAPCVAHFTAACVTTSLDAMGPMIKRSAETALTNAQAVFSAPMHDLSPAAEPAGALLLPLLRHSKPAVVQRSSDALRDLAARVHGATERADLACAIVAVMNGSSGSKPKSGKERAALADVIRGLCPAAADRRALHRMHGDFRLEALRVATTLAACVASEPVAEAQAAVLLAAEAWVAAAGWQRLYTPVDAGNVSAAVQHAEELVAVLPAFMGAKADADIRTNVCGVAAALALDAELARTVQPVAALASEAAASGATKAALRGAGCAGLAAAAAAAAAGEDADSAAADSLIKCAQKLLEPAALAGIGRHAAYAAVATWHLLRSCSDPATVALLSRALAAMAIQNDSTARSATVALLPKCIASSPPVARAVLQELWRFLEAYPDIPGIECPPVAAGETSSRIGAKLVAHRAVAAATTVAQTVPKTDPESTDLILHVLHHPVVAEADIHAAAQHSASRSARLLRSLGLTDGPTLAAVATRAASRLRLRACDEAPEATNGAAVEPGTPYAARSEHLAAERSVAAALAVDPDAVWPACFAALKDLLCPDALMALHVNDVRTFRTPRGRLMVEEFQSQLSPDELFAQRGEPTISSRPAAASAPAKAGGGGKKKAALSKDEQQRQERLQAEEEIRVHVACIRQQLQVGCGLLIALARASPSTVRASISPLLPLILPVVRNPLTAEAPAESPHLSQPGAFAAVVALAATLPLRSSPAVIAGALQAAAAAQGARTSAAPPDPMRLAVHPAMESALTVLSQHVDTAGPLAAVEYPLVFPAVSAILELPSPSHLHPQALSVFGAHVDARAAIDADLLAQHVLVLYHVAEVAPMYRREVQAMLTQLLPRFVSAADVEKAASGFVLPSAECRTIVLTSASESGLYTGEGEVPISDGAAAALRTVTALAPLWIAMHDADKKNAESAAALWSHCGDVDTGSTEFIDAVLGYLQKQAPSVRAAAAKAASHAAGAKRALVMHLVADVTRQYASATVSRRRGVAAAVSEIASALEGAEQIAEVMRFVLEQGLTDRDEAARRGFVDAGSALVSAHGASQLQLLMPLIEKYLENRDGLEEDLYDQVRTGAAVFLSGMAQHLAKEDPKITEIVELLKDILRTPSEVVQVTASEALTPLAPKVAADPEKLAALVQYFLAALTEGETFGARRGAAFGLAGLVKGTGISALKKQGIMDAVKTAADVKSEKTAKEGGLMAIECLCAKLGRMFEPYIITILPMLLAAFNDSSNSVRAAASDAARVIMHNLSGPGVKLVLPTLLKGLAERAWRTKHASIELLGAMSNCAPSQLAASLPTVIPALAGVLNDAHPKVSAAASGAISLVGDAVRNPEVAALASVLIRAIADPVRATRKALDALRDTVFVHTVDVSSLALILPVISRGLKERSGDSKKSAARILGNLASLVGNPADLAPYVPGLMPDLRATLIDALPDVRATAARALGSLVRGLGQEHVEQTLPWLLETLSSESSSVERSGAALGLAEVIAVLGDAHLAAIIPGIVAGCSDRAPAVRDGNLTLLVHLPATCRRSFEPHLEVALPCVVNGLADESEEVRGTSMAAARKIVDFYATTSTPLLLPVLELSLLNENWRIRECAVKLLGELLYKIAGTSGKVKLDGGSDEEGAATESYAVALMETLGMDTRNGVLAQLYLVRNDGSPPVRHAAVHVWKSVVVNTPRTLRQILPRLMDICVTAIGGTGEEARVTASRCLGELVRKMSHQVLGVVVPTLVTTMGSPDASIRAGVCLALKEVLDALPREELAMHLPALLPAVQAALCDPDDSVRAAAGDSFAVLFRGGAGSAVEGMLPGLLEGLHEGGSRAEQSVQGLRVIISVRPALLDRILPKLLALPLKQAGVEGAAPLLAEAGGHAAASHAAFVLPRVLSLPAPQRRNGGLRAAARRTAAAAAVAAQDGAAAAEVVRLLLKQLGARASRAAAADTIATWVAKSPTPEIFEPHKPILLTSTIELLGEKDVPSTAAPAESNDEPEPSDLESVWKASKAVLATIDKAEMPSYVGSVQKALSSASDAARREAEPGDPIEVPGLALPKGLEPFVETYLQGLLHGSPEVREAAADAIGTAVALTPQPALKPFVVKVTGPLIRIVGDRFSPAVKAAILRALGAVIGKSGAGLKPFVPQLQTTFLKCLPDPVTEIRLQAAANLGDLASQMTARVDQLALDLASKSSDGDTGRARAYLTALRGVLANAGAKLTAASLPTLCETFNGLMDMATHNEELHVPLASCMGEFCGIAPDEPSQQILNDTALRDPLPSSAGHAAICAIVLPVLARHHSHRLAELGAVSAAVSASVRAVRYKDFSVKIAAVRGFGRILGWAVLEGRVDEVFGLTEVAQTALSPDQDKEVVKEVLHNLRLIAAVEHADVPQLLDRIAAQILPALCAVTAAASGTFHASAERCLARLLQVEHGISHARELASAPNMGAAVKAMLTEPYLRKLASMPQKSAFDETVEELY
eukprot:jgi/Ulvmu1/6224/UM028_0082.1